MSTPAVDMDDEAAETQPLFEVEPAAAAAALPDNKAELVSTMTLRETIVMLVPLVYVPVFVQGLYDYVADPVMPLYASSLGCNPAQVGVVVAAQLIGGAFFNLPAGVLVSRYGWSFVLVFGMLLCSLGGLLAWLAMGFSSLVLALLVCGMGYSSVNIAISTLLRDACPPKYRGRIVSIKGGLGRIAMMLGTAIGGVVASRFGLATTVALRIALPLIGILAYLTMPRYSKWSKAELGSHTYATHSSPNASAALERGSIYEQPALSMWAVVKLTWHKLCTAGYIAFSIMGVRNARRILIPLAGERVGLGVAQIGGAMSLMSLADSCCFPAVGVLSDRHGRKFTGVPAFAMLSAGFFALGGLGASSGGLMLMLAALVIGIGNGMSSGIISMMGVDCSPPAPNSGRFMGIWAVLDDTGGALGPFLVGVMAQEASVFRASTGIGALAACSTAFFWLVVKETNEQRSRPLKCCR